MQADVARRAEINLGETETPSGDGETPSGSPERRSGEAETRSGDPERRSGEAETPSGDPEKRSSEAEAPSGDPEKRSGEAETRSEPSGDAFARLRAAFTRRRVRFARPGEASARCRHPPARLRETVCTAPHTIRRARRSRPTAGYVSIYPMAFYNRGVAVAAGSAGDSVEAGVTDAGISLAFASIWRHRDSFRRRREILERWRNSLFTDQD